MKRVLRKCSDITCVIELANKFNWGDSSSRLGQHHFTGSSGDAVVISAGKDGELAFTQKKKGDSFLVSTNFNLANPENGSHPAICTRELLYFFTHWTCHCCTRFQKTHLQYRTGNSILIPLTHINPPISYGNIPSILSEDEVQPSFHHAEIRFLLLLLTLSILRGLCLIPSLFFSIKNHGASPIFWLETVL